MPKLLYQGHGSFRLKTNDGRFIYVDPYAGEGYDVPADIILVTHQHGDHTKIQKCVQKSDCRIITKQSDVWSKRNTDTKNIFAKVKP